MAPGLQGPQQLAPPPVVDWTSHHAPTQASPSPPTRRAGGEESFAYFSLHCLCCEALEEGEGGLGRRPSSQLTGRERWKGFAIRVLYSPGFRVYYTAMILINLFAFIYTIFHSQQTSRLEWFIALEVFITAMLLLEVILRLVADGFLNFFRSKSNVADVLVTVLCIASLVMLVWLPTWAETIEEDVAFLLRCLRDAFRLLRLIFLIHQHRSMRLAGELEPITLRLHAAEMELDGGGGEGDTLMRSFDFEAPSPANQGIRFSFFPGEEDLSLHGCQRSERSESMASDRPPSIASPPASRGAGGMGGWRIGNAAIFSEGSFKSVRSMEPLSQEGGGGGASAAGSVPVTPANSTWGTEKS